MSRTPGGLVLVDPETRDQLLNPGPRPPFAKPQGVPSFSTGRRINVRLASDYFVTDAETWLAELDRPVLLLSRSEIATHDALIPVLEECMREARPIAIGAPAIGEDALLFLLTNKLRGTLLCAAFEAEGKRLDDIAQFAGGEGAFAEAGGHALAELPEVDKIVLAPDALSIKPR